MEKFRCAIASMEAASGDASEVLAALRGSEEIDAFPVDQLRVACADFSSIVIVADPAAPERTCRRVDALRGQYPAAAIVVALRSFERRGLDELLAAGACDFVSLPLVPGELIARLRRALGLASASPPRERNPAESPRIRGFVYASAASARLAAKLPALSGCDANVLILGETGSGKEVCAQAIHYLSPRADRPWVAVNCGAIPGELVENELFGHVKGAYTTAHDSRAGLVREAEGGTLFLDDVDCLPLAAQAKLLRFLQEREYRPVGSNAVVHADVRVIAASNCNLYTLALRGSFRQDLYFRLNVLRLNLPALRERREDITVLALHFTQHFAREFKRSVSALLPCALRKLFAYEWPGNVRELKHVIERAVLLCSGPALAAHDIEFDAADGVQAAVADESFQSAKSRLVESFERSYLEQVLAACGGNVTHAARAAKKDRRAFFELMRKHAIEPQRFRGAAES